MAVVVNRVRKGFYLDSVALMRLSQELAGRPEVEEAALMIGSRANKALLRDAGLLADEGQAAAANDLIIAVRAASAAAAEDTVREAESRLSQRSGGAAGAEARWRPRSLASALESLPDANLVLISVPGEFAAAEARRALGRGLNVMVFSDNVPVEEERALKEEARERGLLVMGPDCGTALINGVPLAFANAVPRGDIGIVSAAGTGLQEVSCLIARGGGGVSHGIGVGGRDLSDAVGGIMTLSAIDALERDKHTHRIVLISKPPGAAVAKAVLNRAARSRKPFTVCFLGAGEMALPANATLVRTLKAAAEDALGAPLADGVDRARLADEAVQGAAPGAAGVRGLYSGGTLCAEAQIVLMAAGETVASNVPVPGAHRAEGEDGAGHRLLDLGADEYTVGRPHPMIDASLRTRMLKQALKDPEVGVVLLDVVIGYGAHPDPAGELAQALAQAQPRPAVVVSVCGTDADPQVHAEQAAKLTRAGALVMPSNADAAELAAGIVARLRRRSAPGA